MVMRWLMTVQEVGFSGLSPPGWPPSVQFDLWPRRIALGSEAGDEPPPNPNCFDTLQRWPDVVEIRRPDGTRLTAELRVGTIHLNFAYAIRNERDAAGRVRSPWQRVAVLKGLRAADVPPGSEIWGDTSDEDFKTPADSANAL